MSWDGAVGTYTLPNPWNQDRLDQQIGLLAVITVGYLGSKRAAGSVDLVFDGEPTSEEKALVDAAVAGHDGSAPTPSASVVVGEDGKPYTVAVVAGVPTFTEVT